MSISSKTRHRVLNPFMELLEFDGGKDSPVEILHVILLGIVKYLTNDFLGSLNPQDKFEIGGGNQCNIGLPDRCYIGGSHRYIMPLF
ncbi:hypothetical protein PCASD_00883 [Puccinia coronata f. sp. avenae]|uniref:Uncharacterized protein n=1 Tax=Puccinia coronata f. sp. avenae TaxID=200324 RepID=A0A2N5VPM8_9BASI|nr:hypothetical protein PCASD_00883 [Puccinia coronata f. sp. avenae]